METDILVHMSSLQVHMRRYLSIDNIQRSNVELFPPKMNLAPSPPSTYPPPPKRPNFFRSRRFKGNRQSRDKPPSLWSPSSNTISSEPAVCPSPLPPPPPLSHLDGPTLLPYHQYQIRDCAPKFRTDKQSLRISGVLYIYLFISNTGPY